MADEKEQPAVAERLITIHDYLREDLFVAGNAACKHNPRRRGLLVGELESWSAYMINSIITTATWY